MNHPSSSAAVVDRALAEATRRRAASERDLGPAVTHFGATLAAVCERWSLTAVGWFDGGAGMPTLDVTRADGLPAVLKIAVPGDLDAAARVMTAAQGRGYAHLLAWDPTAGAMLSERLGGDLWTEHTDLADQAAVVAPLLDSAWEVPLDHGKPFEGKASGLVAILDDLGSRYGSRHPEALELAATHARDLAATERPEVVCHGDPHGGNILRRGSEWALIDPDGFVGERAYDLGVVVRDACREITTAEATSPGSGVTLLRDGCQRLADLRDVDAERVWRWGLVERVTTGLYLAWHGHPDEAESFLSTATLVARQA